MASQTVRGLFLADGRHDFRLNIGELREIEHTRTRDLARFGLPAGEASLERVLLRLGDGQLLIDEVRMVLRLGLVGGGMDREQAFDLVETHVVPPDLKACGQKAFMVLSAALYGLPDEEDEDAPPSGEPKGEGVQASASPTAAPAGASSTSRRRKPAGTSATSTE